jgi:TetR/AcrR family transcriptional regulator
MGKTYQPSVRRLRAEQKRAQGTRQALLDAALREFAEFGLAGARVDAIAETAGVNKQALYYHFGNKEELFQAALASVYDHFLSEQGGWTDPDKSAIEAMRELIGAIFDHLQTHGDGTAVIADENRHRGSHITADLQRRMQSGVAPMIAAIDNVLKRGQSQGVLSKAADVTQLYMTIIALCMFYFTNAYTMSAILGRELLTKSLIQQWRRHVIDFIMAALETPKSRKRT